MIIGKDPTAQTTLTIKESTRLRLISLWEKANKELAEEERLRTYDSFFNALCDYLEKDE
tara:strand:- start:349 stop:525 length:177 start_codon:yes stop_codon:yes gene_type:complete